VADSLRFSIRLEDFVSTGAVQAAKSLEGLQTSLKNAKSELSGYQAQLTRAKALGDVEGYRKYSALVDQSRRNVFDLAQAAEGAKGSIGGLGSALNVSAGGLVGLAAGAVIAEVAVVGAFVAISAEAVKTALDVVSTNNRMVATFEALGAQGEGSGKKTLAFLDGLAAKLPQTREQLAGWTKQLEAMGVTDIGQLRQQVLATASAQAIMGDSGAEAYHRLETRIQLAAEAHKGLKLEGDRSLKSLYEAGVNVTDVAGRMHMSVQNLEAGLKTGTVNATAFGNALSASLVEKGRGPLRAMGEELGTIGTKALETFHHLFDGVDIRPLTDALRSVVMLGAAGEPTGASLKGGVTLGVNGIIKAVADGVTKLEIFFLTIELAALSVELKLRPVIRALESIGVLSKSLPESGVSLGNSKNKEPSAIDRVVAAVDIGVGTIPGLGAAYSAARLAGHFLGEGLSLGLDASVNQARDAGDKAAGAAVMGMRERLQVKSPSRVAFAIGANVSEGFSLGLGGSALPERSARRVSGQALAGFGAGSMMQRKGAAMSSGHTVSVGEVHVHAAGGVTDAKELTIVGLSTALERLQLASGR
jgi:hypothetical protein